MDKSTGSPLRTLDASLGYAGREVSSQLNVSIPECSLTVIVGPNACGKSTLLRALARLLPPRQGHVILDGKDIHSLPTKSVARRLGLLPQTPIPPAGISVRDLVARGRFPHQGLLRQWSSADDEAIWRAMEATGITDLASRPVDQLSGGQRQRTWISLVLAQDTPLILLDEPTTYLDIRHQLDVLELCSSLHTTGTYTFAIVLHDLNLAFRYATHLIVMKDGRVEACGHPESIVSAELISRVYDIDCVIEEDPTTGRPWVFPAKASPASRCA